MNNDCGDWKEYKEPERVKLGPGDVAARSDRAIKNDEGFGMIVAWGSESIRVESMQGPSHISYDFLMEEYEWLNGSPCSKLSKRAITDWLDERGHK